MQILYGYAPVTWRIISTDSTSAPVKQPLRNKLIMLWKKLNKLSASLKQQRVLVSNKFFVKFQLRHQSCNLPSEGQSCYRRARWMVTAAMLTESSVTPYSSLWFLPHWWLWIALNIRSVTEQVINVFVIPIITTGGGIEMKDWKHDRVKTSLGVFGPI